MKNAKTLRKFANNPECVLYWGEWRTPQEIYSVYQDLNRLGSKYRRFFKDKRQYKDIKEMFLKTCIITFNQYPENLAVMPVDLCLDILLKAKQGRLKTSNRSRRKAPDTLTYELWKVMYKKVTGFGISIKFDTTKHYWDSPIARYVEKYKIDNIQKNSKKHKR